jgi:hypothetical protein
VPEAYRSKLSMLEAIVSEGLGAERALTGLFMDRLHSAEFVEDIFYSELPDGTFVALADELLYEQAGERRLIEEIHAAELERALVNGEDLPDMSLLDYYRKQPALQVASAHQRH